MKGLIIKGIGGFYRVKTADGIFQAKGRGIFKKTGFVLAVGDEVQMELLPDGNGIINSVTPRRNQFTRPPIANIDIFVVVFAMKNPKPNFTIVDRFLIMSEKHDIKPVLCGNKCDLTGEAEKNFIKEIYGNIYPVVFTSGKTGEGMEELKKALKDHKAVFTGPSGVGKSTIINKIVPGADMETDDLSMKTGRGKHTTRHAEIFSLPEGGMVFDTPGFTSFNILEADERELMDYYPEIAKFKGKCRFCDCFHLNEPDCKVRQAVSENRIHRMRYDSYVANMEEIKNRIKY